MGEISEEKVQELKDRIDREFPEVEIVYKSKEDWWHENLFLRAFQLLLNFIGFFSAKAEKKMHDGVANAFLKFILLPDEKEWRDWSNKKVYGTIRHEYVHLKDYERSPIFYLLTYALLPLPFLVSGRAYWELRAYAQNMMVEYELRGEIPDFVVDWVEEKFSTSLYLYMFPFSGIVEKRIKKLRERIENEEIEGHYPEIPLFHD